MVKYPNRSFAIFSAALSLSSIVFAQSHTDQQSHFENSEAIQRQADNREPDSPAGNYKFSLRDIQDTVRNGVRQADEQIAKLTDDGFLPAVAFEYFKDYLKQIDRYNETFPETLDLDESYKTELTNAYVLKAFKQTYPNLIYDESKWMFNSVGGIYANMIILYCSPLEYIVLWGTTLRSYGKFSGYYPFMNEFDVMVRGTMYSHDLDAPGHASVAYKPYIQDGVISNTVDTSNLIPKNVRSYSLEPHSYMVSYAQGNMAKAFLPGAIMPGVFVNQDWAGLGAHIKECAVSYVKSKKSDPSSSGILKRLTSKWSKSTPDKPSFSYGGKDNYRAIWVMDEFLERIKH